MAALIECVIVPGANSRLPCSARRECSTRCQKEGLALSSFRSRKAELGLSSIRRKSFGRKLRELQRQQAHEILAGKLTLGRASISTRAGPAGDDEKETDRGEHRLFELVERIFDLYLRFLYSAAK